MSVKQHEPMCFDSAQDRWWWMDHFLGDQIQDEWRTGGNGSAVVVDQQTGGIVRITSGAVSGNAHYMDWQDIRSLHVDQRASMEYRLKLTSTTNRTTYNGLRFDVNNMIVFQISGANWGIRCLNGGVGALFDSGIAIDTDYHIFRIECHTHGANHLHFYIDGTECGNSPLTANIPDDATDFLQPRFYINTTENLDKIMDIDYVAIRQDR